MSESLSQHVESPRPAVGVRDFLGDEFRRVPFAEQRRLTSDFGRFLRDLHENGIFRPDIVNLILITGTPGGYRFTLSASAGNLHGRRGIPRKDRLRDIARLLGALADRTTRTQRFRFLREYGLDPFGIDRGVVEFLERRALRTAFRHWRRSARQCLISGPQFVVERQAGLRIWRRRTEEGREVLAALLPDPDRLFARAEIVKSNARTLSAKVEIGGRPYFFKRYNRQGAGEAMLNLFRRSRALRVWHAAEHFRLRGIPALHPLLALEERRFGWLGRSWIMSEFIEGAPRIRDVWLSSGEAGRRDLIARAGTGLGRMHRAGCLHGDLKWNNILVRLPGREIVLVDLDGSRILPRLSAHRASGDLQRFRRDLQQIGGADADRFLQRCWRRWISPQPR